MTKQNLKAMLKDYKFFEIEGDNTDIYQYIAPYAMSKEILREFDDYPILTDQSYVWFLVFQEESLIAWASLKKNKDVVKFVNAYVNPEFRRKGIHTELIHRRIDWCEKNGFIKIDVDCMDTSLNQYIKLGFKRVKSFRKWHKLTAEIEIIDTI